MLQDIFTTPGWHRVLTGTLQCPICANKNSNRAADRQLMQLCSSCVAVVRKWVLQLEFGESELLISLETSFTVFSVLTSSTGWREENVEGTAAYPVCHVTRERRTYVPRADFGVLMFSVFRTEQTRFEFVDVCFWSEWHRYPSWRSVGLYPERPGRHPQQSEEPELELEPGLQRPAGFVRAWPDGWAAPSSDSVWGVFSYSVISQHSSPLIWITWKEGCRVFIGLMYWLCLGDHQSLQQCSQTDLDLLD